MDATELNRLRWRCRRGMLENDLILTRFLEYETSLLVKSAAFLACGVAVIFAGMKYEQYIRRKSTVMEPGRGREVVGE